MPNQTYDKQGRSYAKLSEIKAGDVVTVDGDFILCPGIVYFVMIPPYAPIYTIHHQTNAIVN